jgi:hypothetical protein
LVPKLVKNLMDAKLYVLGLHLVSFVVEVPNVLLLADSLDWEFLLIFRPLLVDIVF